ATASRRNWRKRCSSCAAIAPVISRARFSQSTAASTPPASDCRRCAASDGTVSGSPLPMASEARARRAAGWSAAIDRNDAPAALEAVDPRQRQRIDDEAQRGVRFKIESEREHSADRAGMHDQDDVARGQSRKAPDRTADLADKTLAAGRGVACRRFPEIPIEVAKFGDEVVVAPPGPRAEILFAEGALLDRIERERGLKGPPCRAADGKRIRRQSRLECGKGCGIAGVGRLVRTMDNAARSID